MLHLQNVLTALSLCSSFVTATSSNGSSSNFKQRAQEILNQMTYEEKVGQLGGIRRLLDHGPKINEDNYKTRVDGYQNGNLGFGDTLNWATDILALTNQVRQRQINESRLHVPFITVTDSINSLYMSGGTLFPSNLATSATFNIDLFKQAVAAIREEQLAIGVTWVLSPELDIASEQRFGRIGEMFGEDSFLTGEFGHAYVQTMQDKDKKGNIKVATTIKHFIYGDSRGGVNTASQYGGINHIYNDQLRPYIRALEADPAAVMVSYASVDLVPMSINEYLLRNILREQLSFDGIIMSDAGSVSNLYTESRVATSYADAAEQALVAGVQMELSPGSPAVFPNLVNITNDTTISNLVDEAALNILQIKFATGLFDNPLPDPARLNNTLRNSRHLKLARQVAEESIVLLKNDGILPRTSSKIAVLGPFADVRNYGSYAPVNSTDPRFGNSFYQSIQHSFGTENVHYVQGVDIIDTTNSTGISEAVSAARIAGLAAIFLGSLSVGSLGTTDPLSSKRTDGEFFSHADLGFPGLQQQLLDAVLDSGVPTIVVLSGGQPFVLNNSTLRANSIIHTFLGGEFTGDALADILAGYVNPSGKLTISLPQASSALPAFYDYLPSDDTGSADRFLGYHSTYQFPNLTRDSSFPFGFGLSYTSFTISSPAVISFNGSITINTTVTNTGTRTGKEVVQIYYRPDRTAGIEFPVRRLLRFEKVEIEAGASKNLSFEVKYKDLGYYVNGKLRVQKGGYTFWVGSSSRVEDLKSANTTIV
ncbi:hypothetical protein N0V90_009252 [Kalmusia sp. IMI 367209]|nr:hypothetical protein N0V90_009252 [Kalmusia sp. IMI 367209]